MEKKKIVLITVICVAIAALIGIIIGIFIFMKSNYFMEYKAKKDLKTMTMAFYGYYYDDNNKDNNAKKYVQDFVESGLSVNLKTLEVYLEGRNGKKPEYKSLEKCDREKTEVIMKPKEPYGKTDIDLTYKLNCNFKDKK